MWQTPQGSVTQREAWAYERKQAPQVAEYVGRCGACHHIVVHVVWRFRRLPYSLWVLRGVLMQWAGRRRVRKLRSCPQCEFNRGDRWKGFPD